MEQNKEVPLPAPCDQEVFTKGRSLCALDARSVPAEAWVQAVARLSNQQVDWHYSGGIAHVLVLGDFDRAMAAVNALESELEGRIVRRYGKEDAGLYRAGVTDAPKGAIGAITTSGVTEWLTAPKSGLWQGIAKAFTKKRGR